MRCFHCSFQLGVDFSTHFFASSQPAEETLQLLYLAPGSSQDGWDCRLPSLGSFHLILNPAEAESLSLHWNSFTPPLLSSPETGLYFFLFGQPIPQSFLRATRLALHFFLKLTQHTRMCMLLPNLLCRAIPTHRHYLPCSCRHLNLWPLINLLCIGGSKSNFKSKWKEEKHSERKAMPTLMPNQLFKKNTGVPLRNSIVHLFFAKLV